MISDFNSWVINIPLKKKGLHLSSPPPTRLCSLLGVFREVNFWSATSTTSIFFKENICCFTFLSFDKTCQPLPPGLEPNARFGCEDCCPFHMIHIHLQERPDKDVAYGMLKKRGTWYTHLCTNLREDVAIICLHGLMNTYYKHNTSIINHLMHTRQNSLGSWLHISSSSNIHPLGLFWSFPRWLMEEIRRSPV